MIEEEKQIDNSSSQTDNSSMASAENTIGTSTPAEVDSEEKANTVVIDLSGSTEDRFADSTAPAVEELGNTTTQESLQKEVEELKAQLEERTNQCDSFKNQYMRIAADFDNFRKRSSKEKEDLELKVKCNTLSELLPVVDNFERARSQLKPDSDEGKAINKSYQSVYKQLVDSLKRLGVSPMRPEGKEFDPSLHEAVMREASEEHPEGTVIEELMRGYFLGDRVLRHSMVKVAAAPEPQSSVENPSEAAES